MTFGLLIDWLSSSYHHEIWAGIEGYCRSQGINLLTLVTGRPGSPFRWEQMRNQLLEFVDGKHFDGFLFMTATLGNHLDQAQFQVLMDRVAPAPVVSLGDELNGASAVLVDSQKGFRQLLEHLHEVHGYRRFAYAGGQPYNQDAHDRQTYLLDFLDDQGLEIRQEHLLEGEFSSAWGRKAIELLVPGERPDFDVLVCANDDIAIGALEALAHKGLQVPGDLAVTGFDDVPTSSLAALTTARQPLMELGRVAAERLLEAVQSGNIKTIRLDSHTVVRQSCGCLSAAARAAEVEPRAETPLPFAEWARNQGDRLLGELTAEGLPKEHARELRTWFLRAWDEQDSRRFLHGMQIVLSTMATQSLSPAHLHYPLSVLRRWVLQATEPAMRRAFTETTIHQARILVTEILHTQAVQKETRQLLLKDLLSDLNERLIYSRDFDDQAAILLDLFPRLGIQDFRLSLYEDAQNPMASARLVLTEKGREPTGGLVYNPKELFAEGREPRQQPWSYVAEALFDRNAPLGFFLLEAEGDVDQLTVFDQLCERVGRGVETVRRIQALEDQVAQRTQELQRALADLEKHNETLKSLALRDEMTGLYNRRGFLTLAEHQLRAHYRKDQLLTLFFGDLDGLKIINDTRGHEAGDDAIRTTGRLLSQTFRAEDIVARLGGDEFVILAPGCSAEEAGSLALRLEHALELDGSGYRISLGWVAVDPKAGLSLAEWMKTADERLYQVKQHRKKLR